MDSEETPQNTPLLQGHSHIPFAYWVNLPCDPSHDLNWAAQLERARSLPFVVWKFDLGLESPYYPLDEELRFQSIALALKEFNEVVWPEFQSKTLALCFYRGSADFSEAFYWSEKQRAGFSSWLEEQERQETEQSRRIFAAEAFAIYFQMLSHRLPDEAPIFLLFDLAPFSSLSEGLETVSKERFEHFLSAFRIPGLPADGYVWDDSGVSERKIEASVGLVFPETFHPEFDLLLKKHPNAKIVFEAFLTEEWEGLDQLIVLQDSLGPQGLRKIKGFLAAGGTVSYWSEGCIELSK